MKPLSPAEDEELRRLTALAQYGQLTRLGGALYRELRARDRRTDVREPAELAVPIPRSPVGEELQTAV
jgi:hypothetical protein